MADEITRDEYLRLLEQRAVDRARRDEARRQVGDDPAVQRALRAAAWLHVDRSRVRALGADDLECPDTFPPGVDGEAMTEAHIDAALAGDSPGRRHSVVQFAADYISGGDDD